MLLDLLEAHERVRTFCCLCTCMRPARLPDLQAGARGGAPDHWQSTVACGPALRGSHMCHGLTTQFRCSGAKLLSREVVQRARAGSSASGVGPWCQPAMVSNMHCRCRLSADAACFLRACPVAGRAAGGLGVVSLHVCAACHNHRWSASQRGGYGRPGGTHTGKSGPSWLGAAGRLQRGWRVKQAGH